MRRLLLALLAASLPLSAQVISGGGSGNATALQGAPVAPTAPASGNCLVFTTSWGPGSCAGTASANWSALVSGTNTTGAFVLGSGASLTVTGTGTIAATSVPAAGLGAGTISNATTGNAATASACASTNGCWPDSATAIDGLAPFTFAVQASQLPALTGDVTSSAGSAATTVVRVNGAAVPASAPFLVSNASSQLGTGTTLGTANGGTGATSLAGANIPVQTGAITTGHCVEWASGTSITDAGAACGSGGGTNLPIYAQTTVAAGDTTSVDATAFTDGSYTWAANQFCSGGVGQVYHLRAAALLTTSTADNFGLTVWIGGTEVAGGNGMYTVSGISGDPLVMDVNVTCVSTGSSGSIEVSWDQLVPTGPSANSGSTIQVNPPNTATITVNTTSSVALQVKSRINGTGSETLRQTILEY
jgi:hypothetical protein